MKYKFYLLVGIKMALLLLTNNLLAIELKPLTKEDLTPFCQNKMIWEHFNVSEEQCFKAAIPCSKKTLQPGMDISAATEALYSCTFKELNIKLPQPSEDNEEL